MTTEQRIQLLTQLTAGLLASGHYTYLRPAFQGGGHDVFIRTCDNGKQWKEEGARRRFENEAVIRASILLEEIEAEAVFMQTEEVLNTI